jgi:hypothetical protein
MKVSAKYIGPNNECGYMTYGWYDLNIDYYQSEIIIWLDDDTGNVSYKSISTFYDNWSKVTKI